MNAKGKHDVGVSYTKDGYAKRKGMMTTADGYRIRLGMPVWCRIGGPYPRPGQWRVRALNVQSIARKYVYCWPAKNPEGITVKRTPDQLYGDRDAAKFEAVKEYSEPINEADVPPVY